MNNILNSLHRLLEEYITEDIGAVKQHYTDIPDDIFYKLLSLDPTYKDGVDKVGNYSRWLFDMYRKTKQIPNDSIKDILAEFDRKKPFMDIQNRDINKFKDIHTLETVVNNTEVSATRKQKENRRAMNRSIIEKDAEYIGTFGNYEIYTPETYAASCKLGQGTTWCTASTSSENYFNSYTKEGPLYIIINKNNPTEKYQIHFQSNSFMDKDDKPVSPITIKDILETSPELYTEFIAKKTSSGKLYNIFTRVYNQIINPDSVPSLDIKGQLLLDYLTEYEDENLIEEDIIADESDNFTAPGNVEVYTVEFSDGDKTYSVYTEDEAKEAAEIEVNSYIQEDINAFNSTYERLYNDRFFSYEDSQRIKELKSIIDTLEMFNYDEFLDGDKLRKLMEDDIQDIYDNSSEEKIAEELYNDGVLTDDDFYWDDEEDKGNTEPDFSQCKLESYELEEKYIDNKVKNYDEYSYFEDLFGDKIETLHFYLRYNVLDIDSMVKNFVSNQYDYGQWLSSYDNEQLDLGENNGIEYYAYRIE